ncbi:unnamed protein product [Cylindrotheca closterium]|uniref:Matrin-type domain-containing protein n=1 Tax=Cylindrotheca closterium TaxID=2856 RepID=A0AAD2JI71_9STRA|nr:unnamed protein product [Cylindrotheca closterium]
METSASPSAQVLLTTIRGHTAAIPISSVLSKGWERMLQAAYQRDGQFRQATKHRFTSGELSTTFRKHRISKINHYACSCKPPTVTFCHQGRPLSLQKLNDLLRTHQTQNEALYLSMKVPIRGGIDRQNRVGSKFGGGGVSSGQQSERERKERLRQLAMESIDLAKDPYLMRNHLGTYECKLCLTIHPNEANYLSHTQGKKHQQGLAKRAHMEKLAKEREEQTTGPVTAKPAAAPAPKKPRIGRPAYQVFKSREGETNQRCLSFELSFPEIADDLQPRHRFMSAFEQRVESPPDRRYQYLLFAADPYETVAFKVPNEPIDKEPGRFVTHWDPEEKKFTLTMYFQKDQQEEEAVAAKK